MTVQECYSLMGENYDEVFSRFGSEAMVKKFTIKFLDDPCFNQLKEGLAEKDGKKAFSAVHTLKGICLNLGFGQMSAMCSELTEMVRGYSVEGTDEIFAAIEERYKKMIELLTQLAAEE